MCRCDTRATGGSGRESYPGAPPCRTRAQGRRIPPGLTAAAPAAEDRDALTGHPAGPGDPGPFGATHRAMLAIAQCPGTVPTGRPVGRIWFLVLAAAGQAEPESPGGDRSAVTESDE